MGTQFGAQQENAVQNQYCIVRRCFAPGNDLGLGTKVKDGTAKLPRSMGTERRQQVVAQRLVVEGVAKVTRPGVFAPPNMLWVVKSIDRRPNDLTGARREDGRNFVGKGGFPGCINTVDSNARRVRQGLAQDGRCEFVNEVGALHEGAFNGRVEANLGPMRGPRSTGSLPRCAKGKTSYYFFQ